LETIQHSIFFLQSPSLGIYSPFQTYLSFSSLLRVIRIERDPIKKWEIGILQARVAMENQSHTTRDVKRIDITVSHKILA
jgi:hypothetical protein